MNKTIINHVKGLSRKGYLFAALVLFVGIAYPAFNTGDSSALTITSRSMSLSRNVASATATTYTFQATVPTGGATTLGSIEVILCAGSSGPLLGTACVAPTGLAFTGSTLTSPLPSAGTPTLNGALTGQTPNANLGSGASAARIRTTYATPQSVVAGTTVVSFNITGITNTSTAGTFFARMGFFSDNAWTTYTDGGAMANSVQALQNVSFKVQETLAFCVGAMPNATVAHYAGDGTTPAVGTTFAGTASITNNCAQSAGTSINLGIAPDSSTTCLSPVSVRSATCVNGSDGDNRYAFVMLATNAANGASVAQRINSAGTFTQGTLQIASASCSFPSQTDSCIDPVNGNTPGNPIGMPTITTTEAVGMVVAGRNNQGRATNALIRTTGAAGYSGSGNVTGGTPCSSGTSANTTNCWNWNRTGNGTLATATGPIDNEALQILFATKSAITTPPGQYLVDIDYFSVPAY